MMLLIILTDDDDGDDDDSDDNGFASLPQSVPSEFCSLLFVAFIL
jgi:hypothetical protein